MFYEWVGGRTAHFPSVRRDTLFQNTVPLITLNLCTIVGTPSPPYRQIPCATLKLVNDSGRDSELLGCAILGMTSMLKLHSLTLSLSLSRSKAKERALYGGPVGPTYASCRSSPGFIPNRHSPQITLRTH